MSNRKLVDVIKDKFSSLSGGQKVVAKYLMENPEESAFKTALQIGMEVGVSESTVIRLSYALGMEGFTQLQQSIRDQYLKTNSTIYKFQESEETIGQQNNIFANVLARDIEILNNLIADIKEEDIWRVVDATVGADHVIVVGHRYSYGPAYWFSFMLNVMLGKVSLYPSTKDIIESTLHLTDKSIVFVISFPRYTRDSLRYAEVAKEKGATVVAVTDKVLSPIGRIADITLTTEVNTLSGMDAITTTSSLLNLVITGVSRKHPDVIKQRLKSLEKEYKKHNLFYEE